MTETELLWLEIKLALVSALRLCVWRWVALPLLITEERLSQRLIAVHREPRS